MQKQQRISNEGKAAGNEQNTTQILSNFEREIVGVIRKGRGSVSSKGQTEIEKIIDKYSVNLKQEK